MGLSRRNFLKFTAAGIAGSWPLAARAEPYVNNTGLGRGQYVWEGWKAKEGPVVVVVSRSAQLAHVYRGGIEIGMASCATGRPGVPTPTGVFLIRGRHRQRGAKGAAERLTWTGVPLHARNAARYPASYGCVRLPSGFAKLLFDMTDRGAVVVIADERTYPYDVVHAGLLGSRRREEAQVGLDLDHQAAVTDASRAAPTLAVVVSASDRTAYVMRDGVVEAAVPASVRRPETRLGTHVYSLVDAVQEGGASRWIAFGLGERPTDQHLATWLGTAALERVSLVGRGRSLPALDAGRPGTTLVVTDDAAPAAARAAPQSLVVLAGESSPTVSAAPAPVVHARSRRRRSAEPRRSMVEALLASP